MKPRKTKTSKRLQQRLLSLPPSRRQGIIFILLVTLLGAAVLLRLRAAGPFLALEAESGTMSGSATIGQDSAASGGKYVLFAKSSNNTVTYYIDCQGNDTSSGLSAGSAWKTLAKANTAPLKPGQSLLLKRGCSWNEGLLATWTGTMASPILIGAYGSGNNPLIQRSAQNSLSNIIDVNISGSYQIIENISATVINPFTDSACLQNDNSAMPSGYYADFKLSGTASFNTLRYLDASSASVGIGVADTTSSNKMLNNHIHDLHYLWRLQKALGGALGSIGINLDGNNNEAAYNLFERNLGYCTYADGTVSSYSAPFEIFNANRSYVHHNQAFGHRKHFEMGHDSTHTTDDNVLAYNLFVTGATDARGPNIHGTGNAFGPVNRTQIYNNTLVFTGPGSEGLSCDCSGGVTIRNNIFIAEAKSAYFKGNITESNNIYWDLKASADLTTPSPFVQFAAPVSPTAIDSTSRLVNPLFVNSSLDFHLTGSSPAISGGQVISTSDPLLNSILSKDLDSKTSARNIGAYVYP